jgi:predicted TIM-barrel enzyme
MANSSPVGIRARGCLEFPRPVQREDVKVHAVVTVDVTHAAVAEDQVVARAAGQMIARLTAEDQVVTLAAIGRDADAGQIRLIDERE